MARISAGIIAVIGWLSLLLQFVLHITNPLAPDVSFAERLVRFFSYFTVATNIIVAAALTAIAFFPGTRPGGFASKPSTRAAVTVYITVVGIVYSLFLRDVWDPVGWNAVADHALHDVMPILYVAHWLVFAPKAGIGWAEPIKWLVYPAVYFAYSLIRGAVVSWYPYWFADVGLLGYPTALTNAGFVLIGFAAVGFMYAGFAKLLSRTAIVASS
jgi:hypothetical protein